MRKITFSAYLLLLLAFSAQANSNCFVRKATWRESLLASRERLLSQEAQRDSAEFAKSGIKFGNWYALTLSREEFDEYSKTRRLEQENFDANRPLRVADKTVPWQKINTPRQGTAWPVSRLIRKPAGYVTLFYTTVTIPRPPAGIKKSSLRDKYHLACSAMEGRLITYYRDKIQQQRFMNGKLINNGSMIFSSNPGTYEYVFWIDKQGEKEPYLWYQCQVHDRANDSDLNSRRQDRQNLYNVVAKEFTDPRSVLEMKSEDRYPIWPDYDWAPGNLTVFEENYSKMKLNLATRLQRDIDNIDDKLKNIAIKACEDALKPHEAMSRKSIDKIASSMYLLYAIGEMNSQVRSLESMKLAIQDQIDTFKSKYPNGKNNLAEIKALEKQILPMLQTDFSKDMSALTKLLDWKVKLKNARQRIMLENPLLKFEKLLLVSGEIKLASNWTGPCNLGSQLQTLSPVAPDGELTTIYKGSISSYDLDWDAKTILFSDGSKIMQVDVDGQNPRIIKGPGGEDTTSKRYNPCRLPNDDIMFVSTAAEQAVPCTGGDGVANMHLMDKDGNNERRLCYDQDHNWDPCVLNNGRVMYLRWEYTDLPHYFSRILMSMNPDGTDQKEYYGSSSYWPNGQYWSRPIPGHPTKYVTIVSGHHGVSRMGELHIMDPALGRREAEGAVQQIPGYGKKVEAVIADNLVGNSWPKFITPYPLGTSPADGAGKYFLASVQMTSKSEWQLCLVDIFDNITPILTGDYAMPVPLLPRKRPPLAPPRVDLTKKTGTAMIMDIYKGPGCEGFPKGSIKKLRIGTYHYRYPGNGDTYAASHEGGWDIRRIIGTVPVYEDGSAFFEVPANTPVFVQPLDASGQALQVMRSWFTCQPGENLSCIGCHESQNMAPPAIVSMAARKAPDKIKPWKGPTRGFSFEREVQPVLDKKCIGCHKGQKDRPDFRPTQIYAKEIKQRKYRTGNNIKYSAAYMELQKYVRRAGLENDMHIPSPGEFQADTSHLVKLLKKNHYNVQLTRDEWQALYTWIDFNIPYPARWQESHRPPTQEQWERREKMFKLYANLEDKTESSPLTYPKTAKFEAPRKNNSKPNAIKLQGWPHKTGDRRQESVELDLGDEVKMQLVKIGAGKFVMGDPDGFADEKPRIAEVKKPFYMGTTEVSLEQYKQFDPDHENKFIETRGKDKSVRGDFDMDQHPSLPVVRISQKEALAYCEWLSKKTGLKVTLPDEVQWEWACRAGSDAKFSFDDIEKKKINIADRSMARWNYGRSESKYNDGSAFVNVVSKFEPNAWGLYDMHGNVAEWTSSDYSPMQDVDGTSGTDKIPYKVVRGGSWNDTAKFATSASRWRYPEHQPVYDVGFRVVIEDDVSTIADKLAKAE